MKQRLSEMNLPRFPLLSEQETSQLLARAKKGDIFAREKLVNSNLRLVFNLVQRFQNRGYELEDLFQIGTIGLMKAIDKFDPSFQVRFSTYAVPMIVGEIRRFLRDDSPVRVSRSKKEMAVKIHRCREKLVSDQGREPTIQEISHELGIPVEEIVSCLESVQMPTSIHDTVFHDEGDPIYVLDQLAAETELNDAWFDKMNLQEAMRHIPPRLRQILLMRFFDDLTQVEVASRLGISQVQVSRLERQAIKMVRLFFLENTADSSGD